MAKIIIRRKSSMSGVAQSHDVFIGNQYVGELKNGGTIEIPVDVGTYYLTFNSKMKLGAKNATFTCVVNYPNEIVELQTKFSLSSGDYVVEYADNAPHIPISNVTSVNQPNANQGNSYNSAPVIHPKKKSSKGLVAIVAIVIAVFLFFLIVAVCAVLSDGEDTTLPIDTNVSLSEGEDVTKPEVEYIEVTANDLWNAFNDNEVAAEEKYNGKRVKVTGVVGEINSAGTLTSANILLSVDNAFLGCIQCNFNSSEDAKALANLKKGQSVTVTGTCGKLSVTNVMITGCEVVN